MEYHLKNFSVFPPELQEFLIMSVDFLLKHNFLKFGEEPFLQVEGAPMGSKFLTSLANLFRSWWEKDFIFDCQNPFCEEIVWYGCYIDDFLIVRDHYVAPVDCFLGYVNCNSCNLRFTGSWNMDEIHFLDVTLRGDNHQVLSSLFRKPSVGNTILSASSSHPHHPIAVIQRESSLGLYTRWGFWDWGKGDCNQIGGHGEEEGVDQQSLSISSRQEPWSYFLALK